MRIDREGFRRALEEDVLGNEILKNIWENGDTEGAEDYAKKNIFNKPKFFLNLERVQKIFRVDRRIGVKEFLQFAFGEKKDFEMKDDLLESEWQKFVDIYNVDQEHFWPAKNFFKAYITDEDVRDIVKRNQPADFYNCPSFDFEDFQKLNGFKTIVPQYVHDYAYHLTNL
jgi:type I restriction enzyme, R subunit